MGVEQLSMDQKIAVVLMNLPPEETTELWGWLTPAEKAHYSRLWAEIPWLEPDTCNRVFQQLLAA